MTAYTTRITCLIESAALTAAHDYLESIEPPEGTRFFSNTPNRHTADGDFLYINTVMRPSTADAYRQCAEEVEGVTILPSVSPYAEQSFHALPEQGEPVEKGEIYAHNGGAVMARQDHERGAVDETLFTRYRPADLGDSWADAEEVRPGDVRGYEGALYRVKKDHVTGPDRVPPEYN